MAPAATAHGPHYRGLTESARRWRFGRHPTETGEVNHDKRPPGGSGGPGHPDSAWAPPADLPDPPGARLPAAIAGIAAAAVAIGTSALVAAVVAPSATTLLAVGSAFIDLTPSWLKDLAIAAFGVQDKLALQVGMVIVIAALGALAGILGARRWAWGATLVIALSAVVGLAALTRPTASTIDVVPSLAGALAGVAVLWGLLRRLRSVEAGAVAAGAEAQPGVTGAMRRRSFVALSGGAVLLGALAAVGGQVLGAGRAAVESARSALRLPTAARSAPPLPEGVQVDGVGPFVSANRDFFRIDTALTPPTVDPQTWVLRVHGLVEREVELTFDELLAEDLVEAWMTLACVSNPIGGDLIGNAKWLGYPIRDLLARAGPLPGADMVLSTSADGFSASTPLPVLLDDRDALLAVGMNDEPLPVRHGFPVRMVVPGLYGFVSATKWVVDLEVTRFRDATAYWTVRGWAPRGPVKTASRIEVPRGGSSVPPGAVKVGGSAWAQHRGIEKVEVRVDGGPWQEADLAAVPGLDTWRQWAFTWDATPGQHVLEARASDPDGPQTEQRSSVAPDGATGLHEIRVTVDAVE